VSNTVIQIKRSSVTNTPPNGSLSAGELAISYASDKLFSGNSAGTGVDEIGGKLYVDLTKYSANHANLAFGKANTVSTDLAGANTFLQGYADNVETNAAAYTDAANTFLQGYADTAESDAISSAASYTDSALSLIHI